MRSSASECASCSAPGGSSPSSAQDQRRRRLEQPDERPQADEEPAHGRRDGERRPLRVAERDPLRHELADHDVQVGDDQEREDHGEDRRHHRVELVREHLLAERADREARDGHAELHRRDEARRVAVIRSTARARRFPWCSSSMIRVRRDVTRPYSAATKNAFSRMRPSRASSSRPKVTRAPKARAYWAADRRPRESEGGV